MGSGFARKKKEAKLMQEQFTKMQSELNEMQVTGIAGNGLVSITLTGNGDLSSIKIKPECVDKEDIEGLEMLIKAAHADAQKKIQEKSQTPSAPSWLNNL